MGRRPPLPPPREFLEIERVEPLDPNDDAVFLAWCEEGGTRTLWEFCTFMSLPVPRLAPAGEPLFFKGKAFADLHEPEAKRGNA